MGAGWVGGVFVGSGCREEKPMGEAEGHWHEEEAVFAGRLCVAGRVPYAVWSRASGRGAGDRGVPPLRVSRRRP